MLRLIWAPAALRDVQRLYRFLVPKNADAARRAVKTLRESVQILALQPGMGRPAQDMEPEYSEWPSTLAKATMWRCTTLTDKPP